MNRISFCVITLNEEKSLPRALKSVGGVADEIIVVDCGSTDRTVAIASEFGAKIFLRAWTDFADQKNFAISQAGSEWCFTLDADEELSNELRQSLLEWKKSEPRFPVYDLSRRAWYLGAWIKHSGWYPDFQRRLHRKDATKYSGIVHEGLVFTGEVGRLKGDLLHYTVENFDEHEAKAEKYSMLAARKMFDEGKRSWRAAMWFATPWAFLQSFVVRAGFLDGHRGVLIARMAARSVRLKFRMLGAIVREERNNKPR